jgi:hypothetical protein
LFQCTKLSQTLTGPSTKKRQKMLFSTNIKWRWHLIIKYIKLHRALENLSKLENIKGMPELSLNFKSKNLSKIWMIPLMVKSKSKSWVCKSMPDKYLIFKTFQSKTNKREILLNSLDKKNHFFKTALNSCF